VHRLPREGGISKKRPSPHLHEVPTRSNKVNPRTLQTALVARMGEIRNVYRILVGKHLVYGPLRRPRMKRETNTEISIKETGCEDGAEDRDKW